MKTSSRIRVVFAVAMLLGTGAAAWSAEIAPMSEPAPQSKLPLGDVAISWENGKLGVRAEDADLQGLLTRISKATGIPLELGDGVTGRATVSFSGLTVEEAVQRVLDAAGSKNYVAEFEKSGEGQTYVLRKISVMRKGTAEGSTASAPGSAQGGWTEERVREWTRNKYATDWEARFLGNLPRVTSLKGHVPQYRGTTNSEEARAISRRFLGEITELLGIDSSDLQYVQATDDGEYFEFDYIQRFHSVPVDQGRLSVDVWKSHDGSPPLIRVANNTHPNISVSTEPKITAEEALRQATALNEELTHAASDFSHADYPTASNGG